jgi:phosphatidylserine/phosphatidylglycerophosphate/cardiolipin synthase-like enzyme
VTDALVQLATHDLRALADALRGGRLDAPFTALAVSRFVAPSIVRDVTAMLQALAVAGAPAGAIAAFLDAVARDREMRRAAEDAIELVSTGPETAAVPNRDTRVVVSELFASARASVIVVGYAVYQGKQVFRALAERMERCPELVVRMFLDIQRAHLDTSMPEELVRRFAHRFRTQEWPGDRMPEVFYDPRSVELEAMKRASLHAKCIVVDSATCFVSSANFTGAAQLKNIEIGVLIRSNNLAQQLTDHFRALVQSGALLRLPLS